ncbi:transposase [Wolbachia endosymbiont (group B) of Rhopobota naevana]|uniref:transposase n=1 Tax=Wolbachia endosymbiont (group B) of Rhopobota naevana TaxID=2954054 RepID=UPI0038730482
MTPRDREGSFEPQVVRKRQTTELEAKVLSTYASGTGYSIACRRNIKYLQQRYQVLLTNCYQ